MTLTEEERGERRRYARTGRVPGIESRRARQARAPRGRWLESRGRKGRTAAFRSERWHAPLGRKSRPERASDAQAGSRDMVGGRAAAVQEKIG